ncbi:MAG: hypothetical protein AB1483_08780 [Candidatus Zixiibacteriota bacterium]
MKETIRKFKETVEIRSSIFNRIRSHRYFPVALLLTVSLSAACVHIWQRVKVVELVKQVGALKNENAELIDLKKKVYADIAVLSTAARIEKYASDTLGLKRVDPERLFTLVPEKAKKMDIERDDLDLMLYAINRVTEYVPRVTENSAMAGGVDDLNLDSLNIEGADR